METTRRAAGSRAVWVAADQAVSSATNFALTFLVAHVSSAGTFGAFALALVTSVTVILVARGTSGDPLASGYSGVAESDYLTAMRGALSTSVLVGLAASVVVAAVALALRGHPSAATLGALALVVPGVVVQDLVRTCYVVRGTPRGAFVNDLAWAASMAVVFAVLLTRGEAPAAVFLLVWGACGTACAVVGAAHLRLVPAVSRARAWLRETRHLWPYFLSDNALVQGTVLVTTVVVGLVAGLSDVAGMRGVILLFSPIVVIGQAVVLFSVPEISRRGLRGPALRRVVLLLGGGLAGITLLLGLLASVVPDSWGTWALGETWVHAQPLILLAAVDGAASLAMAACAVGLRARGAAKPLLSARVVSATGRLAATSLGAVLAGAFGALALAAATAPFFVAVWWRQLRRASA